LPPVWGRRFRLPTRRLSGGALSLVILAEAATPVGQPILAAAAFQAALDRPPGLSTTCQEAAWCAFLEIELASFRPGLLAPHAFCYI